MHPVLEDMVRTVLLRMPDDPLEFMIKSAGVESSDGVGRCGPGRLVMCGRRSGRGSHGAQAHAG